jgi:asparaginyl-tRNA synthetase
MGDEAAHTRVRGLLAGGRPGSRALVRGWLRTARHAKGVSFLDLVDGSCLAGIQVVAEPRLANFESEVRRLDTGCAVEAEGELVASQGREQSLELRADRVAVIGWAGADYPLQKKRHSFEFLRTIAHLRPRTNTLGAVLRVRDAAAAAVHRFFRERGFVWLHAPVITTSDCEGAGAMFRVSTLDPAAPPRGADGAIDWSRDFFGKEAFLTVSGQLEAEVGALALRDVYTFGPTFRAENSNTARHLAEFWMIEPEMAFCDLAGNMELAEAFLRTVLAAVLEDCAEDLAFFEERVEPGLRKTLEHVASSAFEHLPYTEAIEILERSGAAFEFPVRWGADLQTEHERYLTETHVGRPLIVTDYPKAIKAFYMYVNDDDRTVRAMDVLVPRVGEIVGGSQREHRLDVLERRLAECGLREESYQWYLDLRRFGSVPHAGFGLGFERLVLFATGMANIRDVIPFPRVPGYAEF